MNTTDFEKQIRAKLEAKNREILMYENQLNSISIAKGNQIVQNLIAKGYPLKEKNNYVSYVIYGHKNLGLGNVKTFSQLPVEAKLETLLDTIAIVIEKTGGDKTDMLVSLEKYSVRYMIAPYTYEITVTDDNKLQVNITTTATVRLSKTISDFPDGPTLKVAGSYDNRITLEWSDSILTTVNNYEIDVDTSVNYIECIQEHSTVTITKN